MQELGFCKAVAYVEPSVSTGLDLVGASAEIHRFMVCGCGRLRGFAFAQEARPRRVLGVTLPVATLRRFLGTFRAPERLR